MSEPTVTDAPDEDVGVELARARDIRARDLLVRFGFGALTSAGAGIITIAFGSRTGGIFLAFPAILAATVTLIESEETASDAREDARGALVGSLAMAGFAAVAAALFTELPGGTVLVIATVAWVGIAIPVYFALWRRSRAVTRGSRSERASTARS